MIYYIKNNDDDDGDGNNNILDNNNLLHITITIAMVTMIIIATTPFNADRQTDRQAGGPTVEAK